MADEAMAAKRFTIVTIHPDMVASPFAAGVVGRAAQSGQIAIATVNPRDFTTDRHRKVDDIPYGGGPGMVMKYEPLAAAMQHVAGHVAGQGSAPRRVRRILLSPSGAPLTQHRARALADYDHLVLVCGRYEGIDQRFIDQHIDEELSLGDYVLSGGELAAMVVVDAVARLLPGVLGDDASSIEESFSTGLLEYPQYTRPAEIDGLVVPDVLQSGHHKHVSAWRHEQSLWRTARRRPDLWRQLAVEPAVAKTWPAALRLASRVYLLMPSDADVAAGQQVAAYFGLPSHQVFAAHQWPAHGERLTSSHGEAPRLVAIDAAKPQGHSQAAMTSLAQAAYERASQALVLQVLPNAIAAALSLALDRLLGPHNY